MILLNVFGDGIKIYRLMCFKVEKRNYEKVMSEFGIYTVPKTNVMCKKYSSYISEKSTR